MVFAEDKKDRDILIPPLSLSAIQKGYQETKYLKELQSWGKLQRDGFMG